MRYLFGVDSCYQAYMSGQAVFRALFILLLAESVSNRFPLFLI